jgi:hypothetical protein
MIRLSDLQKAMKGQFIWDHEGVRPMQVQEVYEGNKELARTIFVGLADMYGFSSADVMNHIDCGYDSYRNKIQVFRDYYKIGRQREADGVLRDYDDAITKFYVKTCLCLNCITYSLRRNQYIKLENYLNV